MKFFVSLIAMCMVVLPGFAARPSGLGAGAPGAANRAVGAPAPRQGMEQQAKMASMHVTNIGPAIPSKPENGDGNGNNGGNDNNGGNNGGDVTPEPDPTPVVDNREKEKNACINNNIGVGNTFVWASKFSNTGNYSSMLEDVENPENNVCFVNVALRSSDSKVSLSDLPTKYFEMGTVVECGSWVDEEMLKKRILDAKKSARTWGTVAGAVGGAGIGVGAMELFGNKLIGGKVEGQKSLEETELLISQLKVLKKDNAAKFNEYIRSVNQLVRKCEGHESDISSCAHIEKYKAVQKEFGNAS